MKQNTAALLLLLAGCWLFSSQQGAFGLIVAPPLRSFRTRNSSPTLTWCSSLPTRRRRTKRKEGLCLSSSTHNDNDWSDDEHLDPVDVSPQRRRLLLSPPTTLALLLPLLLPAQPSEARGLVQFPCPKLSNTYHFLRVGTTLLEEEGACVSVCWLVLVRAICVCEEAAPVPITGKRRNP